MKETSQTQYVRNLTLSEIALMGIREIDEIFIANGLGPTVEEKIGLSITPVRKRRETLSDAQPSATPNTDADKTSTTVE